MKKVVFVIMLLCFPMCVSRADKSGNISEKRIGEAVIGQFTIYPKSRLSDIYKFFFQDKFGPGHLLADTALAGAYIRRELSEMDSVTFSPCIDSIGWENNFVRVNLVLIKKGVLSYRGLFEAFIESTAGYVLPDISSWEKEWNMILDVVSGIEVEMIGGNIIPRKGGRKLSSVLPDFEEERLRIEQELKKGNYVGHHSRIFNEEYDPHYRIVSKSVYEKKIKPLL